MYSSDEIGAMEVSDCVRKGADSWVADHACKRANFDVNLVGAFLADLRIFGVRAWDVKSVFMSTGEKRRTSLFEGKYPFLAFSPMPPCIFMFTLPFVV